MPNPAEDMAVHIDSLVPSLTNGTNLYASKVRAPRDDVPTNAVFVWAAPGRPPDRVMGSQSEIRRPVVMIAVRDARQKDGSDLAQTILNDLLGTLPAGYQDLFSTMSAPVDNGYDSDGRHMFMVSFTLAYEES